MDGVLVVYSTNKKSVVKKFAMKKTGIWGGEMNIICNPNNPKQIALIIKKGEIRVIQNWETAPEDILTQKPGEHSVSIKATVEKGQIAFSKDGKSLFLIENKTKEYFDATEDIKSADLVTGKITIKKLPDGKYPYISYSFSTFIGNDEIVVFKKPKDNSAKEIEIFNLNTNQFVRKYDLGKTVSSISNSFAFPHIVYLQFEGYTLNLLNGERDETAGRIQKSLDGEKTSLDFVPVPNIGYVVGYLYYDEKITRQGNSETIRRKSKNGLFFFDNKGNNVPSYLPDVNSKIPYTPTGNFQVSPNGKFIAFVHDDINDDKNDRLIIATL